MSGLTHALHSFPTRRSSDLRIIEFFSAELEAIQDAMAAKHRFEVTQHLLRIIGVCAECRRAMKAAGKDETVQRAGADRKSTRLNSSHITISYAVFCLKKKNT